MNNNILTFSSEYFKEECICDFTVSSMMKRAWAASIEVLDVVDKICTENNIKYYAAFGT